MVHAFIMMAVVPIVSVVVLRRGIMVMMPFTMFVMPMMFIVIAVVMVVRIVFFSVQFGRMYVR